MSQVSPSIKRRCQHCKIVRRKGVVHRICKKIKRHRGRQG